MLSKFEGNRVKFGILYFKNRISRIIHCKNLNWVAEIQPPPPLKMVPHAAQKKEKTWINSLPSMHPLITSLDVFITML